MTERVAVISGAVEGDIDEAVLRSLIYAVGAQPGTIYGKTGKDRLKQQLHHYNQAANYSLWCILLDLDQDADCAPTLRATLFPTTALGMCLRIVVRAVASWLMADSDRLASFLSISDRRIPQDTESVPNPKEAMVNLARHSRRRAIRQDMVPRPGSGRSVGPAYTARLIEFITDQHKGWRPLVAAESAESLRRCVACLRRMIDR